MNLEAMVVWELKATLSGKPVGAEFALASDSDLCASLERFIPTLLGRRHAEWGGESLDGLSVARARKVGAASIELAGTCILISDQTVTPLLISLEAAPTDDRVTSYRVRIGEPGGGRLGISGPLCTSSKSDWLLATVVARLGSIEWVYDVLSDES